MTENITYPLFTGCNNRLHNSAGVIISHNPPPPPTRNAIFWLISHLNRHRSLNHGRWEPNGRFCVSLCQSFFGGL